ncbi:MAG: hypothetical protein RLZZ594_354 [Actinomycetota bacterium]|jgi:uncharacterized YccA/Bax inhibitor family protein
MSISHNPMFNRAMQTGVEQARLDIPQEAVDAEFAKITSTAKMTVEGTAAKVFGMFLVLLATAGVTWFMQLTALILPAAIVGLVLGLVATFGKKVRPALYVAYAAAQGVFLGGLTLVFEAMYPGIAQNAVLATLATAGAMFAAYRFGWIKVNARFTRVMTFAMMGYLAFALINFVVSLATNSAGAYGTGFGWVIALVGVALAAFTLNLDFEAIVVGVREGLPVENEWRAAFGLTASLIWLYVEILRLLAIFNRD